MSSGLAWLASNAASALLCCTLALGACSSDPNPPTAANDSGVTTDAVVDSGSNGDGTSTDSGAAGDGVADGALTPPAVRGTILYTGPTSYKIVIVAMINSTGSPACSSVVNNPTFPLKYTLTGCPSGDFTLGSFATNRQPPLPPAQPGDAAIKVPLTVLADKVTDAPDITLAPVQ